ncbi:MAG: FAD-binding protein [Clostridiales bacterium]|nr:FAD-binding protein [Clostridiales bacterium]
MGCRRTKIPIINTVIIGSGAAAYNCADTLFDCGLRDIAVLTEGINTGTSRNTGSDKQTYYKLGLAGDIPDSVYALAKTLYDGGSVDGDVCMAEAANSAKAFFKLCEIGVPFPTNEYGEYVGYKTDHDPAQRATSAGPLTSKYMTEALEREVIRKEIPVWDGYYVAKIIVKDNAVAGLLAIDVRDDGRVRAIACKNIVLATGGCGGIYADSVYPECHTGSSSLAVMCGAQMSNLCEWQYGLASIRFRWNVSGTYQQVLPRYIADDGAGRVREFLPEYFPSPEKALDAVFLKGYQWPFDSAKTAGSSVIDLIVYHETKVKGNRVYLDFTTDPKGLENGFAGLSEETYSYLKNSGALKKLPIERLRAMNPKAIELYRANGIELSSAPMEVAVCSQHINGGVYVDKNYQSTVSRLYCCGEAAGIFGLYRPGGSALNSTQVGSMRAAQHIAEREQSGGNVEKFDADAALSDAESEKLERLLTSAERGVSNVGEIKRDAQRSMSRCAAFLRTPSALKAYRAQTAEKARDFWHVARIDTRKERVELLKTADILMTQAAVLDSMAFQCDTIGSRGGAVFADSVVFHEGECLCRAIPEDRAYRDEIVITEYKNGEILSRSQKRRPLPKTESWFEKVWREYNERHKL